MKLFNSILTLGPVGYLPAPGTCGSLVTFIALYAMGFAMYSCVAQWSATFIIFVGSSLLISHVLYQFKGDDPSEIVLDELVGSMAAASCLPHNILLYSIGFIVFRILDILKPFGLTQFEKLPGGWGIVTDDLIAGIATSVILYLIKYILAL
jgi:phosphatidylglycerophosphatase A